MGQPIRHRERPREEKEGNCLMKPIIPWRDVLISWDGYGFGDKGPTPSMTSGSSQPSTSHITQEEEYEWNVAQTSSIDPSITDIAFEDDATWRITRAPSSERQSSDELFKYTTEYEECFSGTIPYDRLRLKTVGLADFGATFTSDTGDYSRDRYYEDSENASDDESEWGDEDYSLEAKIVGALPDDLPLAAYLIPVLYKDYHTVSHPGTAQTVVTLGEEDSKTTIPSPPASGKSDTHREKRSRRAGSENGDDEEDDDGGDDEDKRKPKKMKGNSESEKSEPIPRLACPFHKKDPTKYNIQFDEAGQEAADRTKKTEYRACAGPGFKNIQRLKEHLKRKHYPVQCDRCYKTFPGSRTTAIAALEVHRQLHTPCERGDPALKEGISEAQWAQLDKKTSSKDNVSTSVVEKWNHIWTVLFPKSPLPKTPWYDNPSRELTLPSEEVRPFADLFKQMLDYQVTQQDIQFPEDSEETMKARVVALVGKAFAVHMALDGGSSTNLTSTRSVQPTSSSGNAINPIFSAASNRIRGPSTMSSISGPSSTTSMDSPDSVEGYSPTILNITSNPSGTGHGILVESPPSMDLDIMVPKIQNAFSGMDVVVRTAVTEGPKTEEEEGVAQN